MNSLMFLSEVELDSPISMSASESSMVFPIFEDFVFVVEPQDDRRQRDPVEILQ